MNNLPGLELKIYWKTEEEIMKYVNKLENAIDIVMGGLTKGNTCCNKFFEQPSWGGIKKYHEKLKKKLWNIFLN